MAWYLRRSVKILPGIRMNLSKSGLGLSSGIKGLRIAKSPNGKETIYGSIPGTGLRYRKTLKTSKTSSLKTDSNQVASKTPITILFVLLMLFNTVMFFGVVSALVKPASPGDAPKSVQIPVLIVNLIVYIFGFRHYKKRQPHISLENSKTFLNSRFNRNPTDIQEWQKTLSDYSSLVDCIKSVSEKKTDNIQAPEYPVEKGEVVFAKQYAALTNNEMTENEAGVVYLTNNRVHFLGQSKNREWKFSKMTMFLPFDERQLILFQNTDQNTVKGVHILEFDDYCRFQLYLTATFAIQKNDPKSVLNQFKDTVSKYTSAKPQNA